MSETLLSIAGLESGYGDIQVLWGVDLEVEAGEIVCLVGSNGVGKTTLLKTISGLLRPKAGSIRMGGQDLAGASPEAVLRAGIAHVPEGRRLFRTMSVRDNLLMGAYLRSSSHGSIAEDLDKVMRMFPAPRRAGEPGCRHLVRWRAADVRHRPRHHGPAQAPDD